MIHRRSLTARLLRSLVLPIAFTILAVVAYGFWSATAEINAVYDSQLVTSANVLWLTDREDDDPDAPLPDEEIDKRIINLNDIDATPLTKYAGWRAFRVWKHGALVLHSDNARPESVPPGEKGFANFKIGEDEWRSYTLYVPHDKTIVEVAERRAARGQLITDIAMGLLWPLLLTIPFIGLFIWRALNSGLIDLRRLAETLKLRSPDDRTPITVDPLPLELQPLARGLNQLLEKLEASLAHERTFMDNAAHELRTPLAALSIQADVARNAKTAYEKQTALDDVAAGVARAAKLVDQMLMLGRLRHQLKPLAPHTLTPLVREVIKDYVPLALQKHIELSLTGDEQLTAITQPDLLRILLSNLIDNAVKYTPERGSISVDVTTENLHPCLRIRDSGPGIPGNERTKVFDRFYRLQEQAQVGSGLGLAIVKLVAELLQVEVVLADAPGGGLQVDLVFEAASQ